MPFINFVFQGMEEYKNRLNKAPTLAIKAAFSVMDRFVQRSVAEIQQELNRKSEGWSNKKVPLTGSPIGTPPFRRSGNLLKNVYGIIEMKGLRKTLGGASQVATTQVKDNQVIGRVGDSAKYAAILEFGWGNMTGERPYIRPVVHKNEDNFKREMEKVLESI